MFDGGAAEDDASRDVGEIGGGYEVADGLEDRGHGLAREDITGKENAGQNGKKSKLHGFGLGIRLAGDKDTQREGGKKIGECENGKQKHAAMDGYLEEKTHEDENEAKLEKSYTEIRE